MRTIKYKEALNEGVRQMMETDQSVFIIGEGVNYRNGIFGSTGGLQEIFGATRVLDMPLSEDAITGIGIGAALAGMRPVMVHARVDFLMLCMNQLVNHAAKWAYMCGGADIPIVVRAVIGRGWGQGPQHSQSLQALFAHIPGLKVIMPATAYDAKGLMISAIKDNSPVICIEHRSLYEKEGEVPEDRYMVPIGAANIVRSGTNATIVATSHMVSEAMDAADRLAKEGVETEVIDLRTVRPIDETVICESVKKTGRLVVVDTGWRACGIGAEVAAIVAEQVAGNLKANIVRISLPDTPTPSSGKLEQAYYPGADDIISAVLRVMGKEKKYFLPKKKHQSTTTFQGPF